MVGEQPPDHERNRPKPSDKKPAENRREKYDGTRGAPPPRQAEPSSDKSPPPSPPPTWRPNAGSNGTSKPKREQHSTTN
ncbi:MAG: hypothetical protein WCS37_09695, partial [Chloroflexota bacterium]